MTYDEARVEYETNPRCTFEQLAKSMGKSHQAISKYARRNGWKKAEKASLEVAKEMPLAKPTQGSALGIRSEENLAKIINTYAITGNKSLTAGIVGISRETLRRWCEESPELVAEMAAARKAELVGHYRNISEAGRKDWKASEKILSHAPETRDDWGQQHKEGPTIVLNIIRD